jgi:hypothetical protein
MLCPDVYSNGMFNVDVNDLLIPSEVGKKDAERIRMYAGGSVSKVDFPIRNEAKVLYGRKNEIRRALGISEDEFVVTMSDGGYGLANMESTVNELLKRDARLTVIALCGTNKELFERLSSLEQRGRTKIIPVPFTKEVLKYIVVADLFCGKSGANSMAEPAFFGIPIIEAVMGDAASELIIYTTTYAMVMNPLGWTAGSAIISKSKKYISVKKLFINPCMISTLLALPLFIFSISLPSQLMNMITVLGKATSPISMIIIGMRLATSEAKEVFGNLKIYLTSAVKLVVMPLVAFGLVYFLPLPPEAKQTFYIICACPTASIVLNFSEIIGKGQKEAAASVLLSTVLSIASLPVMMLLLPLLA